MYVPVSIKSGSNKKKTEASRTWLVSHVVLFAHMYVFIFLV